jgi:hypothetical protein
LEQLTLDLDCLVSHWDFHLQPIKTLKITNLNLSNKSAPLLQPEDETLTTMVSKPAAVSHRAKDAEEEKILKINSVQISQEKA